jgi:zinc transport system substrate-binding protein
MKKIKHTHHLALLVILLIVFGMVLAACQPAPGTEANDDSQLRVTVSILPQAYFVERIGGDLVSVNVMVSPGADAHTYEPKPEQMMSLSQSVLFFSIGVEYEDAWLPKFRDGNPEMVIVDSAKGIERILETGPHSHDDEEDHDIEADDHDDEDQHDEDQHDDPHVWLSPNNGKLIAGNIYNALAAANPENEAVFKANYEALIADIDTLDNRISETLTGITQRNFMVYHPAWGYFAKEYGLTQLPIQLGGTDPSASELAALIDQALEENIRVIFVQPTFSAANAQAIAREIDGEVVRVDPLARDWLTNLELVAEAFASALGK